MTSEPDVYDIRIVARHGSPQILKAIKKNGGSVSVEEILVICSRMISIELTKNKDKIK